MKIILSTVMVFTLTIANAQSKKEQIENLTYKLDSLTTLINEERKEFSIERGASNQELNSTKMALESKIDLLKNENDSKNDTIESLRQYNQLLISDLNSKADSVEIFKLKKERIIEVNSYYSKIVEDYLIGAINCITKEFAEEKSNLYADVKKCQLEDGFSYKKLDYRQIEQGTTITEYFYKSNLCFFVNVMWMSEGASEFGRLYYDRNGELIQVLSTQFAEMDVENYCYFYTEVSDKEEIKSIINRIASSEKKLNRILGD